MSGTVCLVPAALLGLALRVPMSLLLLGALRAALARATVVHATVQPADHARLAAGARTAIERITAAARREHRHIAKPRRRRMLKRGERLFRKVAVKLVSGGVDHEPAIARFRSVLRAEELDG